MRVLVTGGLGFIGSFMSEAFIERGHDVIVVDDLRSAVIQPNEIDALVEVDTVQSYFWPSRLPRVDLVVHCAAPVGSAGVLPCRGKIVSEVVEMTSLLVERCIESQTPLVNISTSEVYGFSGVYNERDVCRVPVRPSARLEYAVAKLAGEFTVMNSIQRGLRGVSVRPFNVAGPRQRSDKGFVLPTFVEQALEGKPLTIYGDGHQRRAFTAVTDLCDFVCDYLVPKDPFIGTAYNVGVPGNEIEIVALAKRVLKRLGRTWERESVVYTDGKAVHGNDFEEAEGKIKTPNITRALSLGWTPKVELDDLIDMTAAHYRKLVEVGR